MSARRLFDFSLLFWSSSVNKKLRNVDLRPVRPPNATTAAASNLTEAERTKRRVQNWDGEAVGLDKRATTLAKQAAAMVADVPGAGGEDDDGLGELGDGATAAVDDDAAANLFEVDDLLEQYVEDIFEVEEDV